MNIIFEERGLRMKRGFVHYYYLISCPSDVQEELEMILDIIEEINMTIGEENGINIKCLYWKTNATPESGDNGQNIINKQLLNKADGVIALFWTKFGTPTSRYGSGTEEEIEKAILQDKNVMLYFSNKPINPDKINHEQYIRVMEFKKRYSGLFHEYNTVEDFKKTFNRHILDLISKLSIKEASSIGINVEQELSLSEILEIGWFVRRFLLELPIEQESKRVFQDRIDKVVYISKRFSLLDDDDFHDLLEIKAKVGIQGAKGLNKDDIMSGRRILDEIEISLMKKLKQNENAAFQIGRCLGHILMLTEMVWSDNKDASLSVFMDSYSEPLNDFIERAKMASLHLNSDIHAIINSLAGVYGDKTIPCRSAIDSVRLASEKIASIMPLVH